MNGLVGRLLEGLWDLLGLEDPALAAVTCGCGLNGLVGRLLDGLWALAGLEGLALTN